MAQTALTRLCGIAGRASVAQLSRVRNTQRMSRYIHKQFSLCIWIFGIYQWVSKGSGCCGLLAVLERFRVYGGHTTRVFRKLFLQCCLLLKVDISTSRIVIMTSRNPSCNTFLPTCLSAVKIVQDISYQQIRHVVVSYPCPVFPLLLRFYIYFLQSTYIRYGMQALRIYAPRVCAQSRYPRLEALPIVWSPN